MATWKRSHGSFILSNDGRIVGRVDSDSDDFGFAGWRANNIEVVQLSTGYTVLKMTRGEFFRRLRDAMQHVMVIYKLGDDL